MRTKPLNPNSMQVIMENFRKYQTVLKEEFGDHDNKIYLFEGKNREPSSIQIDELLEKFNGGHYNENEFIKIWERSFDYEAQKVDKLFQEHLLQEQPEEPVAPVAAPTAGEAEPLKVPAWLRALGNLINKGIDMLKNVLSKGLDMVVGIAGKMFRFVSKFKEKHPVAFKVIVGVILAAIALTIIYMIANWLVGMLENDQVQQMGVVGAPLCAQAIAATSESLLREETVAQAGKCLTASGVLSEKTYKRAMGYLEEMKSEGVREAEMAQTSLTQCYEGAKGGDPINLEEISLAAVRGQKVTQIAVKQVETAATDPGALNALQPEKIEAAVKDWESKGGELVTKIQADAKMLLSIGKGKTPDLAGMHMSPEAAMRATAKLVGKAKAGEVKIDQVVAGLEKAKKFLPARTGVEIEKAIDGLLNAGSKAEAMALLDKLNM